MVSVLRNLTKNKIKVLYFPRNKLIRKISFNKRYFKYLNNEINGLKWYAEIQKERSHEILNHNQNNNFFYVDIKIFNSKKNVFYRSIIENEELIEAAINHYKKIWPKKKYVQCHGDLTVDNILSNGKRIKFVDWELSGLSKELWGYDLVYLLISSIFFPYVIKKNLNNIEKKVFKSLWKKLKFYKISEKLLKNPLKNFKNIYKKRKWKDAINDHPNKIFPLASDKKFNDLVNNLVK